MDMDAFIEHSPQLYDIGREIAQAYRNELRDKGAVASGDLKNFKWDVEMTHYGLDLIFYLPEHWRYIEYGRGATSPNPKLGQRRLREIIKDWIEVKGIQRPDISTDSLAYLIARKIHTQGYKARHPLQNAINITRPLQERFTELVSDILLEEIKKEEL